MVTVQFPLPGHPSFKKSHPAKTSPVAIIKPIKATAKIFFMDKLLCGIKAPPAYIKVSYETLITLNN
jgi:hypothetical protein